MNERTYYYSSFLASLASNLISPFLSIYALFLGATKTLIGLLSGLQQLINIFFQPFWGRITESTRRKKRFIIIGKIIWAILWIPIAFVKDPYQLIVLISIQSIFSAAVTPAWISLLIRIIPRYKRGRARGNINIFSQTGAFIGSLIGGFLLNRYGFIPFVFYMACLFGILSRIPFIVSPEPKTPVSKRSVKKILKESYNVLQIFKYKKLLRLAIAISFLNFACSIASPLFSVYIIEGMGGSKMDLAIISAIGSISAILFFRPWGTLVDYLGRRTVMLGCIIPISFLPFVYFVAPNILLIYLYSFIVNMSWAGFNLASFAYLADVIPKEKSPSLLSIYNLFTGFSSFIAPLVGGIIADFFGIKVVFILSTILRLSSMPFLEKLSEKRGYVPTGIFGSAVIPFDISYRIENFLSVYSLVFQEVKKSKVLTSFRRLLQKIYVPT